MAHLRLLQHHADLCHHRLAPHSNYNYCTTPSTPSAGMSEPEPPNQPLLSHPVWVEQKPEGNLHTEVGPNPKLNLGSCSNKEEKGKSLPAASGAAD